VLDEMALEPWRLSGHVLAGFGRLAHDARPFPVEVDEVLGDRLALRRVAVQDVGRTEAAQHRNELPAEIESIAHGYIHALPRLGAVCVAGVTADEHAGQARCDFVSRHIIEPVGHALPDLVDRPPGDLLHVNRIGAEDALRSCHQMIDGDVPIGDPFAGVELVEFDVETGQVSALAGNDDDVALTG
jgi:hypothetical protein